MNRKSVRKHRHVLIDPEALLAEQERKLREAAARWKEVNRWGDLTKIRAGLYHFGTLDLSEND